MSFGAKPAKFEQLTPNGMPQGFQAQQFQLLQSLLGLSSPQQPESNVRGRGIGGAFDAILKQFGPSRPSQGGGTGGGVGLPSFDQFFGQLGSTPTALQRQSTDGISHFLNQPAPEQRALDVSMPALQGILSSSPGAGIIDALKPSFDRNLASANQQGGRFGSGNAILRSRAVDDFNLLGAQAAQQGQQTQLQAAQMLSLLANSAGNNPFQRLMGGAQIGQQDAQQADLETQRRLQLLTGLLGVAQGTAFNQPFVQTQAASGGLGGFLGNLGGMALGSFLGPFGAAAGSAAAGKLFGGGSGQYGQSAYPGGMFG